MDMSMSNGGAPWLDKPVLLHSSREDTCTLTPDQCAYRNGYWRYWYQSDHVYALSTIWFIVATVGLFTILHFLKYTPRRLRMSTIWQKPAALLRYLTYKDFYVSSLSYWTPSIGAILLGIIGTAFFLALTLGPKPYYWPNTPTVNYGGSPPIATRTGWMALALLPVVMALSAKANLITALTGISHEKLQVLHHWTGYAMFVLALVHTFPFIVYHIHQGDMVKEWNTSLVYWTGVAALIPQAYLTFMSFPSIRNRFYEFFKATHFLAALVFVLFFFFHCDFRLSSWDYFIATGAVYMFSLLAAQIKTYFVHGLHHATLTPLPAGLIQIKIPTKASWKPGQHVFLRIFGVGIHSFTAHPFTVSSLPEDSNQGKENEMVFYIKPRRGVTARLAKEAEELPGRVKAVMLEGPYGGLDTSLDRFDTILVITGGSGAGFSLAIIKEILRMNNVGEKKRKLQMIFSTRVPSAAEWYQNSLDTILSTSPGSNNMDISKSIHITSGSTRRSLEISDPTDLEKTEVPNTSTEITSDFSRPDIPSIVTGVISSSTTTPAKQQRIGIFTCGPTSMIHDTRAATARAQRDVLSGRVGEIYLHDECFSW